MAVASFQCFAADPWFDCFSITHRVKDGLRPPLRGGLRPSLTRHAIEKDLACIGSAARVWRSGISCVGVWGPWLVVRRAAQCLVGAYGSGRDFVNHSQASRGFDRVGFGAAGPRVPH